MERVAESSTGGSRAGGGAARAFAARARDGAGARRAGGKVFVVAWGNAGAFTRRDSSAWRST